MWVYSQSTGELRHESGTAARCYAGCDEGKNNPLKENVKNVGPLPRGEYTIALRPINTDTHGPFVLVLHPMPSNEMFGRCGFLIHGDNMRRPGTASKGCIIASRWAREKIVELGDSILRVTA